MSDTIELLETIGRDASLRHVPSDQLVSILQQSQASDTLTAAAASGDTSVLAGEFGQGPNYLPQAIQTPGHEEDETDQGDDKSDAPSTPDDRKSPVEKPTK